MRSAKRFVYYLSSVTGNSITLQLGTAVVIEYDHLCRSEWEQRTKQQVDGFDVNIASLGLDKENQGKAESIVSRRKEDRFKDGKKMRFRCLARLTIAHCRFQGNSKGDVKVVPKGKSAGKGGKHSNAWMPRWEAKWSDDRSRKGPY